MHLLRDHPDVPFGIHLTIVYDFDHHRWGPLGSRDRMSALIDDAGYFWSNKRIPELLERARFDEVAIEFLAQIDTVLAVALKPTHFDWHCLADGGRADIFDLTFKLARKYGFALRVHDQTHVSTCKEQGVPVNDHGVLDSYGLEPAGKPANYLQLLRELPAGLREWGVHPSLGNDEAQTLGPESLQLRRTVFDFLVSQEARDVMDEEGILLMDYRALRKVWSRKDAQ